MRKILPIVMRRQRKNAVHALIDKSIEESLGPPDGRLLTDEEVRVLARRVAERYVKLMAHEGCLPRQLGDRGARLGCRVRSVAWRRRGASSVQTG